MSATQAPLQLDSTYLRLRTDSRIDKLPGKEEFWPRLMQGAFGDFHHEYLVTKLDFESSWEQWEIHPRGDEIVVLLYGALDFTLEQADGSHTRIALRKPGEFVFVPIGNWHTCDVLQASSALFITPGEGTQGRPRTP